MSFILTVIGIYILVVGVILYSIHKPRSKRKEDDNEDNK